MIWSLCNLKYFSEILNFHVLDFQEALTNNYLFYFAKVSCHGNHCLQFVKVESHESLNLFIKLKKIQFIKNNQWNTRVSNIL